jgi:hypothetical protein
MDFFVEVPVVHKRGAGESQNKGNTQLSKYNESAIPEPIDLSSDVR